MRRLFICFALLSLLASQAESAPLHTRLQGNYWTAAWIAHPVADPYDYGVYHFRKRLELQDLPESLVIHVSADNRYKLFVNGRQVGLGPARGDVENWPFESYDIRPYLKTGTNILAAQVWNAGAHRPWAQHTFRTGFVLQADDPAWDVRVNSGQDWKVHHVEAIQPRLPDQERLQTFIVVGSGDQVDGSRYPWGWQGPGFSDATWANAAEIAPPHGIGLGTDQSWQLVPRSIPLLEDRTERVGAIRRAKGITVPDPNWFLMGKAFEIPPHSKVSLLVDRGHLTMGYPELTTRGGRGSSIRLTYAEALFDENQRKGNRDEIEGKEIIGFQDEFLPGGGREETYTSLWMRTYRYLQLDIWTKGDALVLKDFHFRFSAYPFRERATFTADDPQLKDIWDVGWRTARLCAGETYFDCPYYEQLQYVGDTRIQALISLYVSGDDRLLRRAIRLYEQSRFHAGLTRSRYPSYSAQVIPPYSLFWINMVHDYSLHRGDIDFLRDQRMGIITVLDWYEQQVDPGTGLVGETPYWNFVDWTEEWPWDTEARIGGVPDLAGGSSILSLQLAYALDDAARLMETFDGEPPLNRPVDFTTTGSQSFYAAKYRAWSNRLKAAVLEHCWDADRGLLADTPAFQSYSQHANLWAILTDTVTGAEAEALMERVLEGEDLIQATFYFKFYLFQALYKLGMADRYLEQLQPWRDMLERGLTTFAEKPDPTRSDCHAWSASPNYDFLATVCGIRPASPGFGTVSISPSLGPLREVTASMPHPAGTLKVVFEREGNRLKAAVTLPEDVSGTLEWKGRRVPLRGGPQHINLEPSNP